ncbi:glycine--tRNA ligase subunit beta [Erythrobacter sp. T5W1-R]|uniref:glycine--tRNA ligase subunit beta n=1 Tax=Erythrobacter sp. T5W1-R TaxID=3101752 RepID=UPI002AFE3605|nr:glycine--tRNA ligase subunit beta [Erythrobacter sp. T5W1-R]MEA1619625.1 glycine--tRNA ligase subunit beta [Erythrobacter sp. T5W1-R]
MADFLLELRCEEIPARMQMTAREELQILFRRQLDEVGVDPGFGITVWSTPRRLTLITRGLPSETKSVFEEAKGPPVGAPDAAIDGFCNKNGVTREQLQIRDVKGRATYFVERNIAGRPIVRVLQEAISTIIYDFNWPKSMRWGEASRSTESLRWVRPLSGIVALLDGEVVDVEVGGIISGRETMGHRFHASGAITIEGVDDYAAKLRTAHVIVDHEERAALIRDGAAKVAAEAGLTLVADEGLVIENAGLTEWPVPLLGRFDEVFLDVPPEVIQLTARVNQKYFVCEDAQGKLANAFICTANIGATDPAVVVDGNRKVLAARLSDARFFWEQDQKTPLAVHAEKLARITFHEKLGTVADKVERVAKLARWLCEEGIIKPNSVRVERSRDTQEGLSTSLEANGDGVKSLADLAEQAARLCKADLVTEMVGEFPELQGLMGGYYAAKEGLPQEVSDAIRDHYKPVGQGDDVPTAPVTVAVALADKLDTIAGFFFEQMPPTGSKDPFALRRSALGVVALVESNSIRLPLRRAITLAIAYLGRLMGAQAAAPYNALVNALDALNLVPSAQLLHDAKSAALKDLLSDEAKERLIVERVRPAVVEVLGFFADRLKVQQREAGVRHDLIDAVFALGGEDDLVRLLARVHALQAFVTTEDGTNLLAGYKRAANILKKEGYQSPLPTGEGPGVGGATPEVSSTHPQPLPSREGAQELSYTPEPAEKALIEALDAAAPRAAQEVEAEQFADAMAALATLRAPIDRFFEEVTVNAEEAEKRSSRLALLARFRDAVHRVADFSRIEG